MANADAIASLTIWSGSAARFVHSGVSGLWPDLEEKYHTESGNCGTMTE